MIVDAVPVSASTQVAGTPKAYVGFSLRETSGTVGAVVRIYDNTTASGTELDTVSLLAGETAREWYPSDGIRTRVGVYVQVVSGAVSGSIRVEA